MDTEPGGEQTQYEGVHTFVKPHAKEAGQLGGMVSTLSLCITRALSLVTRTASSCHSTLTLSADASEGATDTLKNMAADEPNTHGISKSDKIRYGQSIQEGGMGGKTAGMTGAAGQEGM